MEKELNTTKTVLFHMKAIGNVENMTEKARFIIPRGRKFTAVNGIRDNPKFCVTAKSGANREKFIMGGRRVKRLPPC